MQNRFATLVVIVIIALLALFAFQSFYTPQAEPSASEPEQPRTVASRVSSVSFAADNAFNVPGTNVTFLQNVSIDNGKRVEFFTFQNSGQAVNLSLLVFIPKSLAALVSRVDASHSPVVVREDPAVLYGSIQIPGFGIAQRAISIDVPDLEFESGGSLPPLMVIPIVRPMRLEDAQAMVDLFNEYEVFFATLGIEQVFELQDKIIISANQVGTPVARLADIRSHIENTRSPPRQPRPLLLPSIAPLSAKLSIFSRRDSVSFSICITPDCTVPVGEVARPLVRVTGDAALLASIYYAPDTEDPARLKVHIAVDGTRLPFKGGDLKKFDGLPASKLSSEVIVSYPQFIGASVRAPLTVDVEPAVGAVKISPSLLQPGKGGALVLITSDLPLSIESVSSNCFDRPIALGGASLLGAVATVIYLPEDRKNAIPLEGCGLIHDGIAIEVLPIGFGGRERSNSLEQLYPLATSATSWRTCAENYCTCDAASEALEFAISNVRENARKYSGPGYPYDRFQGNFIFNLANFDETCSFGGVDFTLSGKPAPGYINVVSVMVDKENPAARAKVAAFHSPDNFISYVRGVEQEQLVSEALLSEVLSQPWLCHDPSGAPSSRPEDECSRELRSPPFITVAARSR